MQRITERQKLGMVGEYVITKAKIKTELQRQLHDQIVDLQKQGLPFRDKLDMLHKMCEIDVYKHKNIIPTVGREMIANNLSSSTPDNDMRINYTALGTDNTTPANGQTTLISESYRKAVASSTNADNVAYLSAFYSADETSGTFYEHALFSNGTASADTGVMFSRVLLNSGLGITKSLTETLTIDYTVTIN